MPHCHTHHHCIGDAILQAEQICSKNNLRFTQLRRQILTLIWANHEPSKAYDLLQKLGNSETVAKPPTVYRTLDFLLEHGLIHRLHSLNAYIGCTHPQQHRDCYFLICHQCGEIEECCDPQLKQSIHTTTDNHTFQASHISLEIEGICETCQQTRKRHAPTH